jgi:hypothetical protein
MGFATASPHRQPPKHDDEGDGEIIPEEVMLFMRKTNPSAKQSRGAGEDGAKEAIHAVDVGRGPEEPPLIDKCRGEGVGMY